MQIYFLQIREAQYKDRIAHFPDEMSKANNIIILPLQNERNPIHPKPDIN